MQYPKEYPAIIADKFELIYFFDIETTGLNPWRNEIITLSMSVCDLKTHKQIDEIELFFKPENTKFWSIEAENVHKISLQKALGFAPRSESRESLLSFFDFYDTGYPQIICCHALNFFDRESKQMTGFFDWNFLYAEFFKVENHFALNKYIHDCQSTIDFAKEAKNQRILNSENFKLNTLASQFNIELNHHDAKSDREACQKIYFNLLKMGM